MGKYKLINTKTNEETICDMVSVDGMDYYVSDEIKLGANNVWVATKSRVFKFELHMAVVKSNMPRLIIATNNPNIDIPKVVDDVENLAESIIPNLQYKKYVKTGFIGGYNKSQETHPNSDDDMIEFLKWRENNCYYNTNGSYQLKKGSKALTTKELLQLWKEQKPKVVYYA